MALIDIWNFLRSGSHKRASKPRPDKNPERKSRPWLEALFSRAGTSHLEPAAGQPRQENSFRTEKSKHSSDESLSVPDLVVVDKPMPPLPRKPLAVAKDPILETHGDMSIMFQFVEQNFASFLPNVEAEPSKKYVRARREFTEQYKMFQWKNAASSMLWFPPHLSTIPQDLKSGLLQIFDAQRLIGASALLLPEIPPLLSDYIYGEPIGRTMAGLEARMARLRRAKKNIGTEPSVANRPDWYTDAVFAQQSFTGTNPTSITQASMLWIRRFRQSAKDQYNKGMFTLLNMAPPKQLFIQDYSYFRSAIGASPDAILRSDNGKRYGCATVTLFQLASTGELHPVAIVLDYRGSMENSVVIFNSRLTSTDPTNLQATDWPWRYAKMCHQVSDWTHHELSVHLSDCHFVQEAIIVATQRSFPASHIVHRLLEPHWLKTLSINAAARDTLLPSVITQINGFTTPQTHAFLQNAYKHYDFPSNYIPTSLKRRGFSPSELHHTDFHNYPWARNMSLLWTTLHSFVLSVLKTTYELPTDVAADEHVAAWCEEMQSPTGAQMFSFPEIQTLEQLADAVTMCIHISGPLHHSINYLQGYYQSFVPAKPPCLMAPLPNTLAQLLKYREEDVLIALPIHEGEEKIWLLASQFAFLVSEGVKPDETWGVYLKGLMAESREKKEEGVWKAARRCYDEMSELAGLFERNSEAMDVGIVSYRVMEPLECAVSILI